MCFVYILYSEKCNRYYVGYSADVDARLVRHNSGMVTATRSYMPYRTCAFKAIPTEIEAGKEEFRIKNKKAGDISNR